LPPAPQAAQYFGEAKYFELKRATVFGLGLRVTKHKTTRYARNLWGMALCRLATPVFATE